MRILQSSVFSKTVKKLHTNQKVCLDAAVRVILSDPLVGTLKVGDLASVRVYKFRMLNQLTLLAYQYTTPDTITLLALGSHENFYCELKLQEK